MTRLREKHDRLHVVGKNELRVGLSVEEKIKFDFRMRFYETAQRLIRDPSYPFELVTQQQTCVYGYLHEKNIFGKDTRFFKRNDRIFRNFSLPEILFWNT